MNHLPKNLETGIYYGWASVDNGMVHKMVMSIGWNPYYENDHKSMVSYFVSILFLGHFIQNCDCYSMMSLKL